MRVTKATLVCLGAVLWATNGTAQGVSCPENLDSLDVRMQRNYAGYRLEVTGARARSWQDTLAGLRRAAAATSPADCFPVLRAAVEWLDDPHLFVFQNADADSAGRWQAERSMRRTDWTEDGLRDHFARHATALDPLEGIWYDRDLRLGVIREDTVFVAVVLSADTAAWPLGAVRATFRATGPGEYDAELTSRRFGMQHLRATLHRNALLRFSPGTWGKALPLPVADSGFLDPVDPRRPTLRVVDGAPVFTIPSHDPQYRSVLDSLVRVHQPLLAGATDIIIDIRGNEGGGSLTTRALHPWIASASRRPTPFDEDSAVMLSSPEQLRYARRAFGPDTSAFVRSLVARLTAQPGELVPLEDPAVRTPPRPDSVAPGVHRVGVLVDGGTVSAAEVLVLRALRSTRARVFGEPTAGALDYQSAAIIRLNDAENRWFLGYPTITRTPRLPAGGMRGRGIAPDVPTRWSEVDDPIRHVLRALRDFTPVP